MYSAYTKAEVLRIEGLVIALYFSKPGERLNIGNFEDYHNVKNNYFIAELTMEGFVNDEFSLVVSKFSRMIFISYRCTPNKMPCPVV